MKWLTNMGREDILRRSDYLRDKIIGDPKGTDKATVEKLKEWNIVGVYSKED